MRLAIQTSSGSHGLALFDRNGQVIRSVMGIGTGPEGRTLGALFSDLIAPPQIDAGQICEVIVDLGPGGLSSTRAGVSFANAYAHASRARLFGVSSLVLLMLDARRRCDLPLVTLRPAPGGEVCWARFDEITAVACGTGRLGDVLEEIGLDRRKTAIAGPLARLRIKPQPDDPIVMLDIDPPDIAGLGLLSQAELLPAGPKGILEPFITAEGLGHGML